MSSKKKKQIRIKKNHIKIGIIAIFIVLAVAFVAYQRISADKGSIAATVNGKNIMKETVLQEYLKIPPEYRTLTTVDQILDGMIIQELMLQEAEKMGISATETEVEDLLSEILVAYGLNAENLEESLAANDLTVEELKSSLRTRIIVGKLLNETSTGDLSVSAEEVETYYTENLNQFTTPEKIKASHILVNTSKEATSIRNKALGGAKFEDLAKQYSTCPSGPNGGDLGFFSRGQMVKEFEDVAFALEDIGDISGIVETQFGFHIIKLTDRSYETKQTFSEVAGQIESMLLTQKQQMAIESYVEELKEKSDIEIFMVGLKEPEGTPIGEIIAAQKAAKEASSETTVSGSEEKEESQLETQDSKLETGSSLAECIVSKGIKMYGSSSSDNSNEQRALFGDEFSMIDYVDCDEDKDLCKESSIISYPTWVINGKKHIGKYSLERLAELAGC